MMPNWREGLLAVGFLLLMIGVGWSMSTFTIKLVVSEKGFGFWLDRDAFSLLLLTVMEGGFYWAQLRRKKGKWWWQCDVLRQHSRFCELLLRNFL